MLGRLVLLVPLVVVAAACDTGDGRQLREPSAEQRVQATNAATTTTTTPTSGVPASISPGAPVTSLAAPTAFSLTAPWAEGGAIARRFTCDGRDRSPPLNWTAPPSGTAELALVMSDDDADFIHWVVVGLPAEAGLLDENSVPEGLLQVPNDFGDAGYGGPCPPPGTTHTYRFQLYALRTPAAVAPDASADAVVASIEANQQAVAVVTGTYTRS